MVKDDIAKTIRQESDTIVTIVVSPKPNISRHERIALKQLWIDKYLVKLTANKEMPLLY